MNNQTLGDILASDGGIIGKCVTHTLYHNGKFALYGKNKNVLAVNVLENTFYGSYEEFGVCKECQFIIRVNEKRMRRENLDVSVMVSPHLFPRLLPWQAMKILN